MATRLERFKKSKLKHAIRMTRVMNRQGRTSRGFFEGPYMPCPNKPLTIIGKLKPLKLNPATRRAQETRPLTDSPPHWTYTEPTRGQFPVISISELFKSQPGYARNVRPLAVVGMQYRPRVRIGLKPGRMPGWRRRLSACNLCRFLNGYYPNDDVLSRHPNEDDVFGPDEAEPLPVGYWT